MSISAEIISSFSEAFAKIYQNGSTIILCPQAWYILGSSVNLAVQEETTKVQVSTALHFIMLSNYNSPVFKLKAEGQIINLAPIYDIIIVISGNLFINKIFI